MNTYAEKLKDPRWQKKRLEILNRDNFSCQLCGDKETSLHIHHLKYNGHPWDAINDDLITLCKDCHSLKEQTKYFFTTSGTRKYKLVGGAIVYFVFTQKDIDSEWEFMILKRWPGDEVIYGIMMIPVSDKELINLESFISQFRSLISND